MRFPNQIQAALTKFGQAKILILKLMPNKGKWTESTVEITIFSVPNSQHHFKEKAEPGVLISQQGPIYALGQEQLGIYSRKTILLLTRNVKNLKFLSLMNFRQKSRVCCAVSTHLPRSRVHEQLRHSVQLSQNTSQFIQQSISLSEAIEMAPLNRTLVCVLKMLSYYPILTQV